MPAPHGQAEVPILGRKIPIIADEYVDMEFGTGALETTPMLAQLVEEFLRGTVTSDLQGLEITQQLAASVTV